MEPAAAGLLDFTTESTMSILKERGFSAAPSDTLARQSYAGMAHFAGTGPEGQSCNRCLYYDYDPIKNSGQMERPCKKFQGLTGQRASKNIPGSALACKYFEARR
jgi:hypothetical protein